MTPAERADLHEDADHDARRRRKGGADDPCGADDRAHVDADDARQGRVLGIGPHLAPALAAGQVQVHARDQKGSQDQQRHLVGGDADAKADGFGDLQRT